jgi:Ca2+-binding RTX toxin-like protein
MATINGTANNDTLTSAANADIVNGLAGSDTLYGNAGADSLYGGDGTDSLFGGTEDDILSGGLGGDTIDGGDGIDTLDYTDSNAAVDVNMNTGTTIGGHAAGDIFGLMENLRGSAFHDTLDGDNNNNVIWGLAGNDRLDGRIGADTLYGGLGDDAYFVESLDDVISELSGGGIDTVNASFTYTLGDDFENLTLFGTQSINGTGNASNNIIRGNAGAGVFTGDNHLMGLGGNDTIYGDMGLDILDGGTGNDVMYGGKMNDIYVVDSASDQVLEYITEGDDTVQASISYTLNDPLTSNHVENILLLGAANLNATGNVVANKLTGNDGANIVFGNGGNDTLRGELGDDTLDGGTGNDDMIGGAGNDIYYVDSAQDEVDEALAAGTDTVFTTVNNYALEANFEILNIGVAVLNGEGNNLDNTINGNALNNLLKGGSGNDTLNGLAGNDSLDGGTGSDSMVGGTGDDLYYVDTIGDVAVEGVTPGGYDRIHTKADHVMSAGIEEVLITSTSGVDVTGNDLNNIMTGGTGENVLIGLAGLDSLYGGNSADTLMGGSGVNLLNGGAGNDTYVLENATDVLVELAPDGTDTVEVAATYTLAANFENLTLTGTANINGTGNLLINVLTGNAGNNLLVAGDGADTLYGGAGNDLLDGGTGNDSMEGGTGDDTYTIDAANDRIRELSTGGIDTVQAFTSYTLGSFLENLDLVGAGNINATGNSLANIMWDHSGNNQLFGEGGNDTINAGDGADTLDGGTGNDSLTGGVGDDTYVIDSANDVIVELASQGTDTVISGFSLALGSTLENLTLSGNSGNSATGNGWNNVLTGNAGANLLSGLSGNDTLHGGDGADTLSGGSGNDSMIGGLGNDTFVVDSLADVVVEGASGGTDLIQTAFTTTLADHFENLTLTGTADLNATGNSVNNIITGNSGANQLLGLGGADTLNGGTGDDTMDGGIGSDSMVGGVGNDVYYVDASTDIIVEAGASGTDMVFASANYIMSSNLENLTLAGTASINATGNTSANLLTGNAGNNILIGGSGHDTINGGDGNDELNGGIGNDAMTGGFGNDIYYVNSATDLVIEGVGEGTDTVIAATSWTLSNTVENLTMTSTGGYAGTGNGFNNVIIGNTGLNTLRGMDGNDQLNGGNGNDVLTGGNGTDQFVFNTMTAGNDTITDYNTLDGGVEEGDLFVFTGLQVGSFVYMGEAAFSGGSNNSEARFDTVSKKLLIDADGNGTAEMALNVTGLTSGAQLDAADFLWN